MVSLVPQERRGRRRGGRGVRAVQRREPVILAQSDADCKILIFEDESPPLMTGVFAVRAADLLEALPNLLEQERDD